MDTTNIETGFILDAIKTAVELEPWQEHFYDDTVEGRGVFLGTVFALLPSGKYYTPWASSNVELCPTCKGRGTTDNPQHNQELHDSWQAVDRELRTETVQTYGAWHAGKWPESAIGTLDFTRSQVEMYQESLVCETCNGLGSQEAYHDELWYERANSELESIGLCLENGEGDPCDLFAMEYRDKID